MPATNMSFMHLNYDEIELAEAKRRLLSLNIGHEKLNMFGKGFN